MFSKHPLALVTAAIIGSSVTGMTQAEEAIKLGDVVVTASRTAQSIDETLAPVTVITREDIERKQATSVTELLDTVPGVSVTTNGGPGSNASIFIRGADFEETLVLVDGQRIGSATLGTTSIQYLDPQQIDRIEVVRGPRSSLYGADAIGGVIQIFTRKGHGKPKLMVRAGTGSRDTNQLGVNFSGSVDKTSYNLGASLFETQGYDFTNDNFSSNAGKNLDKDAYRNKSLSANFSHQLDDALELGASFTHVEGKNEYDDKYSTAKYAHQEFKTTAVKAYGNLEVNDAVISKLDLGYSKNHSNDVVTGKDDSKFVTKRVSATWQNDIALSETQLLTAGLDYYKDSIESSNVYADPKTGKEHDSRYNYAAFAQDQISFNGADLQVGLRADKNEAYGTNNTGNISLGFDLPTGQRLISSFGTGFKAPTFNNLYFPKVGNPDIKPERSKNYELELRGQNQGVKWSFIVFRNDIKDLIDWAPDPIPSDPYRYTPSNVADARLQGLESSISTNVSGWALSSAITLLDPKNQKSDKVLVRRARQSFKANADRNIGKYSIGGTLKAQSHSFEDDANKKRIAGFTTADLRMAYQFDSALKGELKLTNVFDKDYENARGYRAEPRGAFVTFIWTPEL